jgi:hypothetical protein
VDAACQNDRFSCRAAEWEITPLQQYSRCERTQHENPIHRLGSKPTFAAAAHENNVKPEDERPQCGLSRL